MELRVLRYFLAICQEKNITNAAERLHISQPSLSRQIKDLEEELGVTLFIRGHRQITLTEDGYFLRDRAQEMVTIADNTTTALAKDRFISGKLNIGAGQTPAMAPIMKIIDELLLAYPTISVNLVDENADATEHQVKQGSLNFGIIMGDRPLNDFNRIILPERNQFVAIFNQNLPLAKKSKVTAADLANYPVILSNQSFVSDKFRNWWGNNTHLNSPHITYNLVYNAALLAKQGHVVEITYTGLVNTSSDSLLTERPLSPKITDPNILIWKKGVQLSNLEQLFVNKVHEYLNSREN
ncbi:LysR family transcriptional regulator [Limosilactobacillus difficilis]|uniref:LysR family transcriptional regulator n=1 Tax=Limosilactobacillus difficilis TaxID=2991838 RepID=UPI0024B97C13|nr:LysR family transcriptional regulator [Limosilactobacillus difficilis]